MRLVMSLVAIHMLIAAAWVQDSVSFQSISADEVARAIEWGKNNDVQPYPLRSAMTIGSPVGAVLTPFIRVAAAARLASLKGESLDDEMVSAAVRESFTYVVIWDRCDDDLVMWPGEVRKMELLPEVNTSLLGSPVAVRPNWLRTGSSAMATIAPVLGSRCASVGAFALDSLKRSAAIALYSQSGEKRDTHRVEVTWAVLAETDRQQLR